MSTINMSTITIYKISHIIEGSVKKIYVFNGTNKNKADQQDKLFLKNPADKLFDGIFSPTELTDIQANAIQVRFIPEQLHLDDTIETVKKKIIITFKERYKRFF